MVLWMQAPKLGTLLVLEIVSLCNKTVAVWACTWCDDAPPIFFICVYWLQPVFHQLGIPRGIYRGCTIDNICQFALGISQSLGRDVLECFRVLVSYGFFLKCVGNSSLKHFHRTSRRIHRKLLLFATMKYLILEHHHHHRHLHRHHHHRREQSGCEVTSLALPMWIRRLSLSVQSRFGRPCVFPLHSSKRNVTCGRRSFDVLLRRFR